MAGQWRGALLCAAGFASLSALGASLDAGPTRVLHYEPFTLATETSGGLARKSNTGGVRELQFSAYGRRFDLNLEKNSRLAAAVASASLDAVGAAQSLYRGTLENVPGSWVRMSAKGDTVRGMIWDGRDLYVVELAEAVRDSSAAPVQAPPGGTVIFKLADTVVEQGAAFCGAQDATSSMKGSDAYQSMLKELQDSPAIMQAAGASLQLELSALGDSAFLDRFPTEQEARDEILLRLNNVDGIFSSQLGVAIQVPTLVIETAASDSFSATTTPATLLAELSAVRRDSPALSARGLTHLFTGRNLDGTTVGIAYQKTLCSREYGVGITEASGRGAWIESLIAAHEVGHNFGAVHDGEAECAATPQGEFLMSPTVNQNSSTFSDCSLASMIPRMQSAICVVALPPADLSIAADLGTVHQPLGVSFDWALTVVNSGGSTSVDARAELLVPPVVTIDDAWVAGGSCVSGAGSISCQLGDIPGSVSRVVHLTLHSDVVGSNSISARVTSQSDAQAANNEGSGTLAIESVPDLAASVQSATSVVTGSTLTATFSAANVSAIEANAVNVAFTLSAGLTAASAQLSGGTCFVDAETFRCTLPSLAPGATANGTIVVNAIAAGQGSIQVRVENGDDPNSANDAATAAVTITEPVTNSAQDSGGGGGSTGPFLLLGMLGLHFARRRS